MSSFVSVRESTFQFLRETGMTTIFGNPGSTELAMFRDFPADFRYVLGLQESIVMGMADGFAQATGRAALVNLHSAAGLGHAMGNLFTAFKNQTPLVVTAGQQARAILPFDPFLYAERATEFPRPYVKWAVEPARAEDVPLALARAFYISMEAPRGPTFVSIPTDDWDVRTEPVTPRRLVSLNPGDYEAIAGIAARLSDAHNPALVVAAGAARDDAWIEIIDLAERLQSPVWAAPFSARCSFPEDHPLFAGFLPAFRDAIVASLRGHDLVIVFGGPLSLYHAEGTGSHVPENCELILIGDNFAHATWAPEGTAITANVKSAVRQLLDLSAPEKRLARNLRRSQSMVPDGILTDAYLMQRIAELRPVDSIIIEEAPSSRDAMHDHLPITVPHGYFSCASGGLGHGLPAAIGIALGTPSRKAIAILGDGSSMYAIQGLWTAYKLGVPLSFVIIKNQRYEALEGFARLFGVQEPLGTKLPDLDFCGLARSQGLQSRSVSDPRLLDEALSWSFAQPAPTLLEVIVD